ncbi:MAG TPA: TenA family protein [Candidatus Dormibacteraeota bacterium]|nr:TenA family protein [Candidatus Dormibacteraeota bacterium]HVC22915.1 TenA family protein [Candidatus Dormibacteraeota bacterium]
MSGHAFTDQLWMSGRRIFEQISTHPFVKGIGDGSLPQAQFHFFLTQDQIFLDYYARSLCALAVRAADRNEALLFSQDAVTVLESEQEAESRWLDGLTMGGSAVPALPAPTTLGYGNYLLASTLTAGRLEALTAVLPCYWVYSAVGQMLARRGSPSVLYQEWIGVYADPDFDLIVNRVRQVIDAESVHQPEERIAAAEVSFLTAMRYEWAFWDMAWNMESWPLSQ